MDENGSIHGIATTSSSEVLAEAARALKSRMRHPLDFLEEGMLNADQIGTILRWARNDDVNATAHARRIPWVGEVVQFRRDQIAEVIEASGRHEAARPSSGVFGDEIQSGRHRPT